MLLLDVEMKNSMEAHLVNRSYTEHSTSTVIVCDCHTRQGKRDIPFSSYLITRESNLLTRSILSTDASCIQCIHLSESCQASNEIYVMNTNLVNFHRNALAVFHISFTLNINHFCLYIYYGPL